MKEALNRSCASVGALVEDTRRLAEAGAEGRLAVRADTARHQGEFRRIVEGVNATLDAVVGPLEAASRCVDAIARGAIPAPVTEPWRGDFALLQRNLNTCIASVNALVSDASRLARAAAEGQLSTRADASRHQGDFRAIVEGVNATLDAVIGPIDVATACVEQVARGQLPAPVTQAWAGDLAKLRQGVNGCIEAVQRLVTDADGLLQAAVAGRLESRAEAAHHQGEFRKIVEGVNQTLDAVLAPVQEAAGVLERLARRDLRARVQGRFQGDHARIPQATNATAEALHDALVQVSGAVEQVSGAATQIASSSQAVASGASEQASSLEETGASVESVSSMARQASDHAQQAHALATTARAAAADGAGAVEQLQGAMGRIKASAEGTSQNHPRRLGHRLPDQPAGAQRRGRGRPGRRGRPRLRGGGRGGPLPGPARQGGGRQDRGADPRLGAPGRRGRGGGEAGGGQAGRDRPGRLEGERHRHRDRRRRARAGHRPEPGQRRHLRDGQGHAAERRQRRGVLLRRQRALRPVGGAGGDGGHLPAGAWPRGREAGPAGGGPACAGGRPARGPRGPPRAGGGACGPLPHGRRRGGQGLLTCPASAPAFDSATSPAWLCPG
ncbi:MAG: hypothetical protein QM767_03975 [Anaeromyxobacter sp.]